MKTFKWCPQSIAMRCQVFSEPHAHICVRSIGAERKTPDCDAPALHLAFHDLGDNAPGNFHAGLFKLSQAKKIIKFVEKHDGLILVNCEAGVSRSPGIVLALRRHFGGDTEEVFTKAVPNIFVASLLTRALRGAE